MSYAREVNANDWGDESVCPNCASRDVVEFGYKIGGRGRTSLECRACGAYSTWRVGQLPPP